MSGDPAGPTGNPLLDAALSYASRGWSVFPLHSITGAGHCTCGGVIECKPAKHPRTAHGFMDATTDERGIREWWKRWPDANIGIATGARSGIVVLDIDHRNDGMSKLRELEGRHGDLPLTLIVRTGNGYHLYFKSPDPGVGSRVAIAGFKGLDFKGDGGYVVAPPSRHVSGNDYLWELGPDEATPAPMPDWLIKMIALPAPAPVPSETKGAGNPVQEGQRNDVLFRLACSLRTKGLTEPGVTAALQAEHVERCEPPLPEGEVLAIVRSAARYPNSAISSNSANQGSGANDWEPPAGFQEFDLPTFPTSALPGWLRDFVEVQAEATQVPTDLVAMVSLSTIAAALAKKVIVRPKEGYYEPVNIFTVTAMDPGTRKSSIFAAVTAPLREFERDEIKRLGPEIAVQANRRLIKEKMLEDLQKKAAKATVPDQDELAGQADQLARELEETKLPELPRLIADDTTPEKLATLMYKNGGRMAVMGAEGTVFDLMAGRYSANGTSNFDVYLKGHASDDVRVDRMGRSEYVKEAALTLGLTVQPQVLQGLAEKPEFEHRGLLGRFLYSIPRSLLGVRKVDPDPVPETIREANSRNVLALLQLPAVKDEDGHYVAHELRLDTDARALMLAFEREIEHELGEGGDLIDMKNWAGKLVGATYRIAGLLHMAEHATEPEPLSMKISVRTAESAIVIARYLVPHAKAAHAIMGTDAAVANAKHILSWVNRKGLKSFAKREAFEATKGRFKTVPVMEPALKLLVDHGHIREREEAPRQGPGRKPSPIYDVNPHWLSQNSQNSQNAPLSSDSANTANCASDPTDQIQGNAASPSGNESIHTTCQEAES